MLLVEVDDSACEEKDVACILIGVEPEYLLKIGLCIRQRLQLFIGEAPKEIGPDEVWMLSQTGVQAGPSRFPMLRLQVANGKEKLCPEMAGLQGESTVEAVAGPFPVAAPAQFFTDQEVIQRSSKREGTGSVPLSVRLFRLSGLFKEAGPAQVVRPGLKAELARVFQELESLLMTGIAYLASERLLSPDAG